MPPASNADLKEAAAAWAVRLSEGALSEEARRELDAWLAEDPRRQGALVRARASWADLDRLVAMEDPRSLKAMARPDGWRPGWREGAIAASLAAAVLGGGFAWDRLAGRLSSEPGEVRRVVLEDGSTVVLNASSVVQVRYRGDERRVLLRRGEASFDVAHDSKRPFIVAARDVSVRAVGTSFVVRMADAAVAVTVAEGVVEVKRSDAAAPPRRLERNLQLVVAEAGPPRAAQVVDGAELSKKLAWREGLLVFRGDRLVDAVAQVNRYAATPVRIDDPDLGREGFVGVFRIGDSEAFVRAAAASFGAQVESREDGLHLTVQEKTVSR